MVRFTRSLLILSTLALAGAGIGGAAHAQVIAGPGAGLKTAKSTAGTERSQRTPPPAALPGAGVDKEMVAPAERPASEMQPTEALFDAVNRGDAAAARDAINRGAEIDAKNVLGLTPLDLSIDLGRRDISFLLLSMRGATGTSAQRPPQQAASASKPTREERVELKAERTRVKTAAEPVPAAPRTPKLYAGDGGSPVPTAGFLGFGGTAR